MENPLGVRSENSLTQKCGGIVNSSRTKVVAINMNHVSIYKDILGALRRNEKRVLLPTEPRIRTQFSTELSRPDYGKQT